MNIRDIARLANVTPGTVSKVLNNYPDISEATRQHVLQIIKENQYTTKNGGRKFKQAVTPRIGLVSENVYNWVSETMQNLLSERFHNADYTVLSFQDNYFSQNKNEKFQELLTYIDRHQLTVLFTSVETLKMSLPIPLPHSTALLSSSILSYHQIT